MISKIITVGTGVFSTVSYIRDRRPLASSPILESEESTIVDNLEPYSLKVDKDIPTFFSGVFSTESPPYVLLK